MTVEDAGAVHAEEIRLVIEELRRQWAKWGDQKAHPDGAAIVHNMNLEAIREHYAWLSEEHGEPTWGVILAEEVAEAQEEIGASEDRLREELIQVAAVAVAWASVIRRR